jgi:hypothetical protein
VRVLRPSRLDSCDHANGPRAGRSRTRRAVFGRPRMASLSDAVPRLMLADLPIEFRQVTGHDFLSVGRLRYRAEAGPAPWLRTSRSSPGSLVMIAYVPP